MICDSYGHPLDIGDRVRYSAKFLRSCGIYTGLIPQLRGRVTGFDYGKVVLVSWDYPEVSEARMLGTVLHKLGTIEPN